MQSLVPARGRILLLLVLVALSESARALTVKIGTLQTIPQVDPLGLSTTAYQACFGLQAAFNEANDNELLGSGVDVQLSVRGAQLANVTNNTLDLLVNESAVMIAASSLSASYVMINLSRSMRFPLLGQQVTESFTVNDPTVTSIINYRFSYAQELWHMINIALNSKLRCKRFAIVAAAAGIAHSHGVRMLGYLKSLGHVNVTMTPYGNATVNAQSIAAINASQPQCVFFIADANTIQNFSLTLLNQPWVQPSNLFFITWSGVSTATWPLRMANRTFIVQQVPSPIDTKYDLVRSYQAALAALDAKGYYDPPGKGYNLTYGYGRSAAITPSYSSLEAYVVGRMAIEILRRLPSQQYTWSNIIDAVYAGKMFAVNDTLLGPYMAGCNGQVAQTGVSCYCNSGNKVLYTSYVGPSGTLLPYHIDPALLENPSAESLEMPMPVCLFPDGEVRTPTLYVSVHEVPFMLANPNTYAKGVQYQTMFVAAQVAISKARVAAANLGDVVVVNEPVMSMDATSLQRLADRYPLAAFAGGVHSPNFSYPGVASLAGYDGGQYMLVDPPLSEWREENIALEPVIADFVHALAAKLSADIDSSTAPAITIFATSAAEVELAAKSLHTFQLLFDAPVVLAAWTGSLVDLQSLRVGLLSRREPGHVIFVVSQVDSFVDAVVKEATSSMTQQPFYIATAEEVLERSMDGMTAAELGAFSDTTHNVFFSSVVPPFWQRNAPATSTTLLSVYDSLRVSMALNHSFALLRGCRLAVATYSALDGVFSVITTAAYRTVWYTQGTVASLDLMYGPFSNVACTPETIADNSPVRKCQCSKGARTFFVHSLTDWALQTPHAQRNVTFSYTHEACGAAYVPLMVPRPADHLTITLTATVMSGVAALLLVVAVYCASRPARDNSCAPKDPYSPYTVVFTDIQSSTALWARVPQQMADAVETHHAIIRELIQSHECYEVKTIGDSFMVACKDPKAAARLALDLQLAFFRHHWGTAEIDSAYHDLEREWAETLAEQQHDVPSVANINTTAVVQNSFNPLYWNGLRVRIGIHHGFGEIRQDHVTHGYDYYGTVVNTAARVEGVGHGGQILLTETAFDAAGGYHADGAFADASVTSLGPQPLRGLDQPVVLYQVVPGKLKGREFRPLRLDVERDIESESDPSGSDTVSQHSTLDVTPEVLAQRAARRAKGDLNYGGYFNEVLHAHSVVVHLFSTQPEKQKRHLLEQVAHKWRVPLRKSTDKSISAQDLYERQLMSVMLKVYAAYDKKISTGSRTGTHSHHGTQPGGSFMGEDKDGSASDIVSLARNRDPTTVVSPTNSGKGQISKGGPGSGHSGRTSSKFPTSGGQGGICGPDAHDDVAMASVESDAHPDATRGPNNSE